MRQSYVLHLKGAFDLDRGNGDPVILLQDIIPRDRLPIDPDKVIRGLLIGHVLTEEFIHSHALLNVDIVRIAPTEVIHVENFHDLILSING